MNKIKRDLRYLEKWWNNSLTSGIRLGVLGTKHNAAITLHALSKEICFVAEETEGYIGLNFHGKLSVEVQSDITLCLFRHKTDFF